MEAGQVEWGQIVVGLSTLGAAIGSAIGQQWQRAKIRDVLDKVLDEKLKQMEKQVIRPMLVRIEALEDAKGWKKRAVNRGDE